MASEEKRRCPSCGGTDTRRSYPGGVLDMLMEMFRRRPYRCRGCRRRFYGPDDSRSEQQPSDLEETV